MGSGGQGVGMGPVPRRCHRFLLGRSSSKDQRCDHQTHTLWDSEEPPSFWRACTITIHHKTPNPGSGEVFVPLWLLFFLGASFPMLHHLREGIMTGMIPEQECWRKWEMDAKTPELCPRPGIITHQLCFSRTQDSSLISLHLGKRWFPAHSQWTANPLVFHQEAHIPVTWNCTYFWFCPRRVYALPFKSPQPCYPLSWELAVRIPSLPHISSESDFPGGPVTLSSAFNHLDNFRSFYLIPCRALWGSWAQRPFCVPHFFNYRKQPPWPFLSPPLSSMTLPEFQ